MSDCSGAEGAFFALKAINKRATLVSSLRLLFPRNHPVVVQDLKDRMERKHNQEDENINLTVKPRNKKPTWPSKHWDVMKDYKVNPKQVAETCKGQELQKLVSNLRQRHALAILKARGVKSGIANLSQSIGRQGLTQHVPCMTPKGEFFVVEEGRYITGWIALFACVDVWRWNAVATTKEDRVHCNSSRAASSVLAFLQKTYFSIAETLPHEQNALRRKGQLQALQRSFGWLKDRLQNTFQKSGLDFNVAYITNVRNWCDSMAAFSTLAGAYKKRKDDTKEIPHSFTFARRDRVAAYLDDDRKEVLLEVASYLEDNYSHYGRGILYLRQLAGQYALPRSPAPRIEFLLTRHAGIQRGAVILPNAEVHTLHNMRDIMSIFTMDPVQKHVVNETTLVHLRGSSVKGAFLDISRFSFAENAKFGELGRWPATHQFRAHFPSFIENGFEGHREPLDIKFDTSCLDHTRASYTIKPFSVGYVDGQNKALIMLSVLALLVELEVTAEMMEEDPAMAKAVASMFYIKCNFKKHAWRVSDPTRRLIYNLLRSPVGLWDALKICYNESKPQDAALTMDNLDDDYFVVGNELVLLQVCCLMTYVWPKIQNFLGNGELLDGIMNQWKLGALDAELRVQVKLGTDDEAEGDDAGSLSADAILRDFRYNLQCIYMEPARDLRVRPICVFFDPATVYGTREGFHPALLVTSMDKHNVFLKSPVYKAGVVSGVGMLPRSEMVKAEKCGKYATDMRLTRVQKLVKSLISEDNTSNVIVDLLGFDAWPACFAMKELATGANFACSTACHSPNETSYCTSTIGEKLYGMCRSNQIKLPGFPEFEQVVADLRKSNSEVPPPEFQVCLPVPNGLAIRENLVEQWTSCDLVEVEMKELLKKHNDKYNPHGIKRGSSDQGTTEDPAPDAKRLRIDSSVKMAEHEAQIANKLVLNCGTFKLVYDSDQDILWAGAADGKKKDTFEAKGPLELFGFGSGDFLEGPDAKDVQQDLTGRWLTFKLESGSEHCILEADRRLPDHVKKMDIFGKVLTYADVLQQLENAGEVNTKMSMHWIDRAEGTGTITFRSAKNVVFVLDPPKNKDPKKQKKDSKAQLSMGWGNAGECV
ncbi:Uncharacterized protein SCF082_LOCUS49885 [Durusdinium trenchii]|uniref:Uncharacterized protein n=1 Tax=Durusdinium trenchii TaxID=1381693 RepID=A0ABP0S4A6_9DINO